MMALPRPWRGLHLRSTLCDSNLWLEILTDLTSIFVLLYVVKVVGDIIVSGGWLAVWVWLVEGKDAHMVYVVGNVVVLLMVYWIPGILYTLVDLLRPEFLYKYKVQKEKAQSEVNMKMLGKVVSMVLMNQVVQGIMGGRWPGGGGINTSTWTPHWWRCHP